jgi:hypothetical protein
MEKFKCSCGFEINVDWNEGETERLVPCGGCYFEEFENKILKSHTEIVNDKEIEVVEEREYIKHENGLRILCVKGKGI